MIVWRHLRRMLLPPLACYLVAALLPLLTVQMWGLPAIADHLQVLVLPEGSPAARAGLRLHDVVLRLAGEEVGPGRPTAAVFDRIRDQSVPVEIERNGQHRTILIQPDSHGLGMPLHIITECRRPSVGAALQRSLAYPFHCANDALCGTYRVLAPFREGEIAGGVQFGGLLEPHPCSRMPKIARIAGLISVLMLLVAAASLVYGSVVLVRLFVRHRARAR